MVTVKLTVRIKSLFSRSAHFSFYSIKEYPVFIFPKLNTRGGEREGRGQPENLFKNSLSRKKANNQSKKVFNGLPNPLVHFDGLVTVVAGGTCKPMDSLKRKTDAGTALHW